MAIEEVWVKYLTHTKGNKRKALMLYKGTVTNYKSFNRTWKLYKQLQRI